MVMQLFRIIMCAPPQTPESDRVFLTKLHVFKKPGRAALGVSWCGGQTIGTIFCQYEWARRMAWWFRNIFLKLLEVFPLENFLWLLTKHPSAEASAKRLTLGMEGSGERKRLPVSPIWGPISPLDLWYLHRISYIYLGTKGLGTHSAKLLSQIGLFHIAFIWLCF